jgi:hypothetical protein
MDPIIAGVPWALAAGGLVAAFKAIRKRRTA